MFCVALPYKTSRLILWLSGVVYGIVCLHMDWASQGFTVDMVVIPIVFSKIIFRQLLNFSYNATIIETHFGWFAR